nr:formin-like protein 1 [Tanacetum cinerariifolium]
MNAYQPQGVSVWEGAEAVYLQAEETKLEYSRNIVTNSRETPSWREFVSLTVLVKLASFMNADAVRTKLLDSLLKMAPTKEKERKLKEHIDDTSIKLGHAEKLLKAREEHLKKNAMSGAIKRRAITHILLTNVVESTIVGQSQLATNILLWVLKNEENHLRRFYQQRIITYYQTQCFNSRVPSDSQCISRLDSWTGKRMLVRERKKKKQVADEAKTKTLIKKKDA